MAYPYSIPLTIQIAKVCQVLAQIRVASKKAFRGGVVEDYLPILLYTERKTLEWLYLNKPTYDKIDFISNYVYALCGDLAGEALRILGLGGGGVVIDPQQGQAVNLIRYREDFKIGGAPAPNYSFVAGDTSYTVPLKGFIIASFLNSGVAEQIGLGGAGLNGITYNKDFVTFQLNQPVVDGEQYTVEGLRAPFGTTSSSGGSGASLPQPYKKGQFLTNDGTELLWDDVIIEFTAADFIDATTYINPLLANYSYSIDWINVPTTLYENNGDFTSILSGGCTFNVPGFDATANPQWKFRAVKRGLNLS